MYHERCAGDAGVGGCGWSVGGCVWSVPPSATLLSIIAMTNTTIGNLSEGLITQLSCRKTLTHRSHPCSEHHPKAWRCGGGGVWWVGGWLVVVGCGLWVRRVPLSTLHDRPRRPSASRTEPTRLLTSHVPHLRLLAGLRNSDSDTHRGSALSSQRAGRGRGLRKVRTYPCPRPAVLSACVSMCACVCVCVSFGYTGL